MSDANPTADESVTGQFFGHLERRVKYGRVSIGAFGPPGVRSVIILSNKN